MLKAYDIDAMSKAIAEFYSSKTTYKNEWVEGKWYGQDGKSTYKYKGSWKKNSKGWWFEDETGWYPKNQWQKIDGKWYFFNAAGYMEKNAYRNGYYP